MVKLIFPRGGVRLFTARKVKKGQPGTPGPPFLPISSLLVSSSVNLRGRLAAADNQQARCHSLNLAPALTTTTSSDNGPVRF